MKALMILMLWAGAALAVDITEPIPEGSTAQLWLGPFTDEGGVTETEPTTVTYKINVQGASPSDPTKQLLAATSFAGTDARICCNPTTKACSGACTSVANCTNSIDWRCVYRRTIPASANDFIGPGSGDQATELTTLWEYTPKICSTAADTTCTDDTDCPAGQTCALKTGTRKTTFPIRRLSFLP